MEDFTFEELEADIFDFFSEERELRRAPEEGEFTAIEFTEYINKKGDIEITARIGRSWMDKAVRRDKATMRVWRNDRGYDSNLYRWKK